jgi:hypothetical protein
MSSKWSYHFVTALKCKAFLKIVSDRELLDRDGGVMFFLFGCVLAQSFLPPCFGLLYVHLWYGAPRASRRVKIE